MATTIVTPAQVSARRIVNPPAWEAIDVARQASVPVSPIVAAQRAGEALYTWTMQHTGDGEQAAVNYHLQYQNVARELGIGPACGCDLCRDEFGLS
jgi:hypothetical protein